MFPHTGMKGAANALLEVRLNKKDVPPYLNRGAVNAPLEENMSAKRVMGIDFGTSNSVGRVKRYGEDGQPFGDRLFVSNILFDGNDSVPTLVQIPDDIEITPELELKEEDCEFGRAAAVEQPGMRTWRDFKTDLESKDPGIRMRARWLTRLFLKYIYRQYQTQSIHLGDGTDEELVYVSYPAKYSEENRQFMIQAAKDAGFSNVRGITEPEAAVRAFLVQGERELRQMGLLHADGASYLLFLDMGAGTTDLAVCKYENGSTQIISTWPDDRTNIYFGGKDIDQVLSGYVEAYLRSNNNVVPSYFTDHFSEKYIDAVKAWKEVTVSRTLKRNKSVPYFSAVKNPYPNLPDFSPAIGRKEFEDTCKQYLCSFPELVNGCLAHTREIDPDFPGTDGIELVLLTGGHSQWYFIPEILTGKNQAFGSVSLPQIQSEPARVRLSGKPQEMVAVGMVYDLLKSDHSGEAVKPDEQEQSIEEQNTGNQYSKDQNSQESKEQFRSGRDLVNGKSEVGDKPSPIPYYQEKVLTREEVKQRFHGTKNIIIPEEYTTIGENAFGGTGWGAAGNAFAGLFSKQVTGVETVQLPAGLRHIGEMSFFDCKNIKSIKLPQGLLTIGDSAFKGCNSLQMVTIPGSVKKISQSAFEDCKGLKSVIIENGVEEIGWRAFRYCTSLSSVTIKGHVKKICEEAFGGSNVFMTVVIEDDVENIDVDAFAIAFAYRLGTLGEMEIRCRRGSQAEKYAINRKIKVSY